jgi:hypothetical protein
MPIAVMPAIRKFERLSLRSDLTTANDYFWGVAYPLMI